MVKYFISILLIISLSAQEKLPEDNTFYSYHPSPNYRESESHPLRVLAYIFHPIGWSFREFIFRPFSHYFSDSPTRRSLFGYRDPYDFRRPSCFFGGSMEPNCATTVPFNYKGTLYVNNSKKGMNNSHTDSKVNLEDDSVYLPNINFDFNKRGLNDLGKGRVYEIYEMLSKQDNVNVILEGHTDSVGNDAYNQKLGLNRADTVKKELIKLGIPESRISSITFGEKQLKSSNPEWGNALNRRVEVKVN